jgi:hypothetical protein
MHTFERVGRFLRRLSVGRAALYHQYVKSVLTPATPFIGWTQPGGGFALVEGVLLLHWDGADDRKVLGPKRALEAALKTKRSPSLLCLRPSPVLKEKANAYAHAPRG